MDENQPKKCAKLQKSVLQMDTFAEALQFRLENGEKRYQSYKGVLFTLILFSVILLYASMQTMKLASFDETDVMASSKDSHFDSSFAFDDGLQVAFGISDYGFFGS